MSTRAHDVILKLAPSATSPFLPAGASVNAIKMRGRDRQKISIRPRRVIDTARNGLLSFQCK
jgi:hypothetical protein